MFRLPAILLVLAGACSFDATALAPASNDASSRDAATDSGEADTAPTDGAFDAPMDAVEDATIDGGIGRCPSIADSAALALYPFDGIDGADRALDVVGGREATVVGEPATSMPGPSGCGDALYFPDGNRGYLVISDAEAWDLPEGSVDLWVRAGGASTTADALFARDAVGEADPGHAHLTMQADRTLLFRIQDGSDGPSGDLFLMSAPLSDRLWHHVGVCWGTGGAELWVDGVVVAADPSELGIDGNDNAWVIGGTSQRADEGSDPPSRVQDRSDDVAIDHFRISGVRRDFSAYAALAPL